LILLCIRGTARRRARAVATFFSLKRNHWSDHQASLFHDRFRDPIAARGFIEQFSRIFAVICGGKDLRFPGDWRIPLPVLVSPGKSDLIINHVINCRATCAGQFFLFFFCSATNESRSLFLLDVSSPRSALGRRESTRVGSLFK